MSSLYVDYAERGKEYDIPFILSLFCEYIHLESVRIPAIIYRVNQAEYVIHIRVVAPHEYVNTYSTRREKVNNELAVIKYSFTDRLSCTNQSISLLPPPPASPTRLQYYCNTIAQ